MSEVLGPLQGLRILDLSRILAGPTCTQLLGDMGADVIKVERPKTGDDTRSWGPPFVTDAQGDPTQESTYYLAANRNKRSLEIDITSTDGQAIIRDLLAHCDVLVENFKVGGLAKYGLDYDSLATDFPKLVYCSITGFGQTGPNAQKAGYDLMAQAFGGIMSLTGELKGEPMKSAVAMCDLSTGLYAATAILAALRHADRTGQGQQIDIALVDVQTASLVNQATSYLMTGKNPARFGNQHASIVPYQVFEVSDGHVIVAVGNDGQFRKFCAIIERADLSEDPNFATNKNRLLHRDRLISDIANTLRELTKDNLIAQMERAGVPGGPINTLSDVFETEQVAARDMKISMPHPLAASGSVDLVGNPIKFSKTPVTFRNSPPVCGADTDDIINEFVTPKKA